MSGSNYPITKQDLGFRSEYIITARGFWQPAFVIAVPAMAKRGLKT
jgi:hypothetical protein